MTKHPHSTAPLPQKADRAGAVPAHDAGNLAFRCLPRFCSAAFTLAELMISVAILGMIAGISLWALSSDNRVAAINRYLITAKAIAQTRIDEAQSVSYTTTGTVPGVLATGATTSSVTLSETAPVLTGTMTTTAAVADATLGLRRVKVVVNYTYRGRPYSVTLSTARAPD